MEVGVPLRYELVKPTEAGFTCTLGNELGKTMKANVPLRNELVKHKGTGVPLKTELAKTKGCSSTEK